MMPTLVTLQERMVLREYVALEWTGVGDIVEIGCFAGGSTVAILQGMAASGRAGHLFAFDTFQFPKNELEAAYRSVLKRPDGDSFRAAFEKNVNPWYTLIVTHEGDASEHEWVSGPIEIMHVDCSISLEFHKKVALEFYPHLMEGAALIHQDFGYEKAPFIKEMMAKLERFFSKKVLDVETTRYHFVRERMTRQHIEAALA